MTTRMSQKQWQALPAEDKEVLKALDILDLVKPLTSKSQANPRVLPKPYVLLRVFTCNLCGTTFEKYFRMLPSQENPYILQAKEITFKDILHGELMRDEKEVCSGCSYCYKVLAEETKEELIKRIITLTK